MFYFRWLFWIFGMGWWSL